MSFFQKPIGWADGIKFFSHLSSLLCLAFLPSTYPILKTGLIQNFGRTHQFCMSLPLRIPLLCLPNVLFFSVLGVWIKNQATKSNTSPTN